MPDPGRRTPAPRRSRSRRPGRRASPGIRSSAARRGSPSGRRTRRRPASARARRDRRRCRSVGAAPPRAPRCTPPIPPVANTRIPAAWHAIIVAATVVAPQPPPAIAAARLRRDTFSTDPRGAVPSVSRSSRESPTSSRPALSATVAGTAPVSRMAASASVATSTFCGWAMPWLISVDSRPTTGRPSRSASATSGATARCSAAITTSAEHHPSAAADGSGSGCSHHPERVSRPSEAGEDRHRAGPPAARWPRLGVDADDLRLDVLGLAREQLRRAACWSSSRRPPRAPSATCCCSAGEQHRARLGHVGERDATASPA